MQRLQIQDREGGAGTCRGCKSRMGEGGAETEGAKSRIGKGSRDRGYKSRMGKGEQGQRV